MREPAAFLFDEPLSRLDVELRQVMRGQIKEVLNGLSKATVIVTHDQLEAMTMGNRIVVMKDGIVQQVGRPLDLYNKPANLFVASFIGSPAMNLIEGEIEGGTFQFSTALEDIHMNVEARLAALIGEAAGRLHTARSRNDQVATDFRLWGMDALRRLRILLEDVIGALAEKADTNRGVIMPAFTHLQPAQPTPVAHWLLSRAWPLVRDVARLDEVAKACGT